MNNKSLWEEIKLPSFPSLDKNIETNVLIIGGGVTGLLCAFELKKRNIDYVVIEKDRIGRGISKNTTAFITAQHEVLYQNLIKSLGKEKAKEYLTINLKAVERFRELNKTLDIEFKDCSSTIYSCNNDEIILNEKNALDSLNYESELIDELPINVQIKKGIKFNNQGEIHPYKLIKEISKGLLIYENTKVLNLSNDKAYTDNYEISFNKVIIATHFPFINRCGLYFMKMYQRRSYVVAIPFDKEMEGTYCSIDENGLYFRKYKDYLIIGGNDRDTKIKCLNSFEKEIKNIFDDVKIAYSWSNQDCVTIDNVPYIGEYSILHKNWYVATGFNLWGFTWAMASSFIIADLIEEKRLYPLVDPKRKMINMELFKHLGTTIKNLVSFKTPRCTHLGCALQYNKLEKTWECPCHGSRYDENGVLLNGPATEDKDLKN